MRVRPRREEGDVGEKGRRTRSPRDGGWLSSPEHSAYRRRYWLVVAVCAVALLGMAWGCVRVILSESPGSAREEVTDRWGRRCVGIGFLVVVVGAAHIAATRAGARGAYLERQRAEAERETEQVAAKLGERPGPGELIDLARAEMKEHNLQALEHARTSFLTSQIAAAAGLVWLFVWTVIAVASKGSGVQIAAGSLSAVGGALSAYVNRTYVRLHEASLRQQNYYYAQPVMRDLLLQAERLAGQAAEKEKLYAEIVRTLAGGVKVMLGRLPRELAAAAAPGEEQEGERKRSE